MYECIAIPLAFTSVATLLQGLNIQTQFVSGDLIAMKRLELSQDDPIQHFNVTQRFRV